MFFSVIRPEVSHLKTATDYNRLQFITTETNRNQFNNLTTKMSTCMVCQEQINSGLKHKQCNNNICTECYTNWEREKGSGNVTCPLCRGPMNKNRDCVRFTSNETNVKRCKCGSTTHFRTSHHSCPLKKKSRPTIRCCGPDDCNRNFCTSYSELNISDKKYTDSEWEKYCITHGVKTTLPGVYTWTCWRCCEEVLDVSDSDDDDDISEYNESIHEPWFEDNSEDNSEDDIENHGQATVSTLDAQPPAFDGMRWSDVMTCHRLLQTYSIEVIKRNLDTINQQIQMDNQ